MKYLFFGYTNRFTGEVVDNGVFPVRNSLLDSVDLGYRTKGSIRSTWTVDLIRVEWIRVSINHNAFQTVLVIV